MKIKVSSLVNCIFLLMIFYPVYMSSLAGVFIPTSMYMYMQIFGMIAMCLYNKNMIALFRNNSFLYLAVLCMTFLVFYGCLKYPYMGQIVYCAYLLFFICSLSNSGWQEYVVKIMLIAGLVYALATYILIAPGVLFYSKFVASMYPNNYGSLVGCYKRGEYAGITGHYSTNATMLANGVIPCIAVCVVHIKNKRTSKRAIHREILLLAVLFVALLLSGKRAHFLFTLCAAFVALYIYTSNEKNRFAKYLLEGALIAFMGVIAFYTIPSVNNLFSRFSNLSEDVSVLKRYELWGAAVEAFKEHPILGNRWASFPNSIGGRVGYNGYTHNVYLELLCEVGIIGTIIFVFFFITCFIKTVFIVYRVAHQKEKIDLKKQTLLLFSLMYQAYFLMYCTTGNPLYDAYVYMPYFMACSIATSFRKRDLDNENWNTDIL